MAFYLQVCDLHLTNGGHNGYYLFLFTSNEQER